MDYSTNGAMIRSVPLVDRFAIGLSALCLVHCLLLPVLLLAVPSLGTTFMADETVHLWLVYGVVPSSLFALGIGCTQHRYVSFILLGMLGLCFLILGIAVESIGLDHIWEKYFTFLGALIIAFAHVHNFRQCRKSTNCGCQ